MALLTLALGIGANTALFSVVNAVLLRQLPFVHADRTVWITAVRPDRNDAPFSLPDFLDYRDHTNSLDSISAVGYWGANVTGRGDAERLNGMRVSANLFETLGVNAAVGRTLRFEDDRPGAPSVVVMTYGLWRIYGVISSSVNQRVHEIAVRMAMGARRSHVLRMVIVDGIKPVLAGLALGILSVFGLSKALANLVYAISASDPATLVGVTLLFGCVSLAALYLPARRATRIDPLVILRTD